MKNAKKSKPHRSSVQAKAPSLRRVPRKELQPIAAGAVDALDSIVMARVRAALAPIEDAVMNACIQRKLLPHRFTTAITEACLLAFALIPARAAQSITGVPASILIADLWHGSPVQIGEVPPGNDYFGTGQEFESIEASFLDRASWFASNKNFQPVMRAAGNPIEYVRQIERCKLWDRTGGLDRADIIRRIQECDSIPAA